MHQVFMKVPGGMYTDLDAEQKGGKTGESFSQQFFTKLLLRIGYNA